LHAAVGSQAAWLLNLAWGRDDRRVVPDRAAKSHGAERTYGEDIRDVAVMRHQIERLSAICGEWLSRKSLRARTVTLKVRFDDFTTVTRSLSVPAAVADTAVIARHALDLLDRTEAGSRPVRLLGVSVHNLLDPSAASTPGDGRLPFEDRDE
jgi:DNA polymerase-4